MPAGPASSQGVSAILCAGGLLNGPGDAELVTLHAVALGSVVRSTPDRQVGSGRKSATANREVVVPFEVLIRSAVNAPGSGCDRVSDKPAPMTAVDVRFGRSSEGHVVPHDLLPPLLPALKGGVGW
jgi:hypothetical protein